MTALGSALGVPFVAPWVAGRPSLALSFMREVADSRIAYSGGANGTRVNSAGLIVPATAPRFDYDPVTLAAKGLLVEEQRTNLAPYSAAFDSWTPVQATVTPNVAVAPDGTTTADQLAFDNSSGQAFIFPSVVLGTTYTLSVYAKVASGTGAVALKWFSSEDGNFVSPDLSLTSEWQRVSFTFTPTVGITSFNIGVHAPSTGAATVLVWGAQLEAGSFATSYIPTTAAAVTRTADSAVMTGTDFSSWFNPVEGTFVSEFSSPHDDVFTGFCVDDGAFNNQMAAGCDTAGTRSFANIYAASALQAQFLQTGLVAGASRKLGLAYKANDFAGCTNGLAVGTDTSGAVPAGLTRLVIGAQAFDTNFLNGHVSGLLYYPRELPATQLQGLTAP